MKHYGFTTPTKLAPGEEGWTTFQHIDLENQVICMRAPLWPEGDEQHRVLVTRSTFSNLIRVWTEDNEQSRQPTSTPALVCEFVVVPTISIEEVQEW